jgi:hypothetical protein
VQGLIHGLQQVIFRHLAKLCVSLLNVPLIDLAVRRVRRQDGAVVKGRQAYLDPEEGLRV